MDGDSGDCSVVLSLENNPRTEAVWDFKFKFTYTLVLGAKTLAMAVEVLNREPVKEVKFTTALHTYYKVQYVPPVNLNLESTFRLFLLSSRCPM